jgi:hypothetical protein
MAGAQIVLCYYPQTSENKKIDGKLEIKELAKRVSELADILEREKSNHDLLIYSTKVFYRNSVSKVVLKSSK